MQHHHKRRRSRVVAIAALVGSVISIGAVSEQASADSVGDEESSYQLVRAEYDWRFSAMRSGIRW